MGCGASSRKQDEALYDLADPKKQAVGPISAEASQPTDIVVAFPVYVAAAAEEVSTATQEEQSNGSGVYSRKNVLASRRVERAEDGPMSLPRPTLDHHRSSSDGSAATSELHRSREFDEPFALGPIVGYDAVTATATRSPTSSALRHHAVFNDIVQGGLPQFVEKPTLKSSELLSDDSSMQRRPALGMAAELASGEGEVERYFLVKHDECDSLDSQLVADNESPHSSSK